MLGRSPDRLTMALNRITLVGDSGVGKSTIATLLSNQVGHCVRIAVAQPLRDLEEFVYSRIGAIGPAASGRQDGRLLQIARDAFEHVSPGFLEADFRRRVESTPNDTIVINDDARAAMYECLRDLRFTLVWVNGPSRDRGDPTLPRILSAHDRTIERARCQMTIDNSRTIDDLEIRIQALSLYILNSRRGS